jgi:hypothetical protein
MMPGRKDVVAGLRTGAAHHWALARISIMFAVGALGGVLDSLAKGVMTLQWRSGKRYQFTQEGNPAGFLQLHRDVPARRTYCHRLRG